MTAAVTGDAIELGAASRACSAEAESGEAYFARRYSDRTLLAVMDGLGHGPEAASSAKVALATVEEHADLGLREIVLLCHERLRWMRGVAMGLAWVGPDGQLIWTGVGNVQAVVLRADRRSQRQGLLSRPGVLGASLPRLRTHTARLRQGDTLVIATDGVWPTFASDVRASEAPDRTAPRVLDEYPTGRDDALVLAVTYRREG